MGRPGKLPTVRNDAIQFGSLRPPGSSFVVLGRKVVTANPPELVAMSHSGQVSVLDDLVGLLNDPDRAWAAAVMLAAMTGREADIVQRFACQPTRGGGRSLATMPKSAGKTGWRAAHRQCLKWDPEANQFVEQPISS